VAMLFALAAATLVGCVQRKESASTPGAGATPQPTATDSELTMTILESDTGKTIELDRGQEIVIRLSSNRTTGYSWTLIRSGTNALRSLGEAVYTQKTPVTGALGGAGIESWSFKATESGREELRFEYRRPWQRDEPPAKMVSYVIRVH